MSNLVANALISHPSVTCSFNEVVKVVEYVERIRTLAKKGELLNAKIKSVRELRNATGMSLIDSRIFIEANFDFNERSICSCDARDFKCAEIKMNDVLNEMIKPLLETTNNLGELRAMLERLEEFSHEMRKYVLKKI